MSTDDTTGEKSRHDDDAPLPPRWRRATRDEEAYLVHDSGARLVIRHCAPAHRPTEPAEHRPDHELGFSGRDSPHMLVPIQQSPSRRGLETQADEFARDYPDAKPLRSEFELWLDDDHIPAEVRRD